MKRPSPVQMFFAHQWPMRLWFSAWTLGVAALAIAATNPCLATFADWRSILSFAVVAAISPIFGYFLGLLAGSMILPPMYALRERLNGGPFKTGDRVQILIGPHKGEITQVISPWQGRSYRVKLDSESEKTFKDIFGADQLSMESKVEPGDAPNHHSPSAQGPGVAEVRYRK